MEKSSHDDGHPAGRVGSRPAKSSIKHPSRAELSKTGRRSRVFSSPSDANRGKRAKFAGEDLEREGNQGSPTFQTGGNYPLFDDGAKTSEYKSFKKLLEKTTLQHLDNPTKNNNDLKANRVSDCMGGLSNGITNKYDNRRSLFPVQNISSVAHELLPSPTRNLHKLEFVIARSVPSQEETPTVQPLYPSSERFWGGLRPGHTVSFSRIRECLLKLAARTCSQNFDEFLSKRYDLIIEFLERLGITRQSNKIDKLLNSEQTSSVAHHLLASSKRSDAIVEFCYPQENSCTIRHAEFDNPLTLMLDNNEVRAYSLPSSSRRTCRIFNEVQSNPYDYTHEPIFSCKSYNSEFAEFAESEKDAVVLHELVKRHSTIELNNEFECEESSHHHLDFLLSKAHSFLNSPWDYAEIHPFPADCTSHMGQLLKYPYINTPSAHRKGVHDVCLTKNLASIGNYETDSVYRICGFYGAHYNPFQSGFLIPDNSDAEVCFQEQAIVPYISDCSPVLNSSQYEENFSFPLLKWLVGTMPQELQGLSPSTRYDEVDFRDETHGSSFTDVSGRKGFNYLQSSNLDILLEDSNHFYF
ncbi:hypothetical protein AXF42_Ash015308 [Apostasia shenzhenica]|uniref:Uncharacterized protein n=1 Tax=Apostasia shenzhenica TaxID=1088818 RepID=A0A2I0AM19_9ASPA|nr:hypothetical protein AXF42_Ash015308 [Apostasia shenzhenica]